jgi:hypothetical protein
MKTAAVLRHGGRQFKMVLEAGTIIIGTVCANASPHHTMQRITNSRQWR